MPFDETLYMQTARIIGGVVDRSEQTVTQLPWMRRDIGNPMWHEENISLRIFGITEITETHSKPKPREISFAHHLFSNQPIVLKLCTEYGSDTAVLCAKFQNDWAAETDAMDERDFARFDFKMSFGRISYITQYPWPSVRWSCVGFVAMGRAKQICAGLISFR